MSAVFHTIAPKLSTPLLIFGDHCSKVIPPEFNDLGLSGKNLTRHIAWDIGTETVIRELCRIYGCAGHLAAFSRLVIDPNRGLELPSLIPVVSDGTLIPGNENLSEPARQSRIERFWQPYHDGLSAAINAAPQDSLIISVHSFTEKPRSGDKRGTDIGLLVKDDEVTAEMVKDCFNSRISRYYKVGINKPYSAHDLNHSIDTHAVTRGLRHLAIEIRQDHINTESGAKDMAMILDKVLHEIVYGSYEAIDW